LVVGLNTNNELFFAGSQSLKWPGRQTFFAGFASNSDIRRALSSFLGTHFAMPWFQKPLQDIQIILKCLHRS